MAHFIIFKKDFSEERFCFTAPAIYIKCTVYMPRTNVPSILSNPQTPSPPSDYQRQSDLEVRTEK